jgi:glucose/arabinose dehydrogenase
MLKSVVSFVAGVMVLAGVSFPQQSVANADVIPPNSPQVSIALTPVASGFTQPLFVTHAGDDRLFVVEQAGIIKIVKNGAILPTPFLSITNQVLCCGEQGLLGLAFAPDYTTSGNFYVYHTVLRGGFSDEVIVRYKVGSNPDVANPASRAEILYIPHHVGNDDNGNHNGGWIGFGPDGLLYAGVGDGGGGGDPFCAAQNSDSLLGKILRLNVTGQMTYTLPAGQTNPVLHIGLRNPWRASFDRQTGEFYIADVGQGAREEVNMITGSISSTVNFGWSQREGKIAYPRSPGPCPASIIPRTEPILDYARGVGTSITGGYVYRGGAYPWLGGVYFFGDYGSGKMFAAWRTEGSASFTSGEVLNAGFQISSFGEDKNGELYVVNYAGSVLKLASTFRGTSVFLPNVSK